MITESAAYNPDFKPTKDICEYLQKNLQFENNGNSILLLSNFDEVIVT